MSDPTPPDVPATGSPDVPPADALRGTMAQALGGSCAVLVMVLLDAFNLHLRAGAESAFGTIFGIGFYYIWHVRRDRAWKCRLDP